MNKLITKCEILVTKNTKSPEDREGYYEPISYKMTCEEMINVLINQFKQQVNEQAYQEVIQNLTGEDYEYQQGGLDDIC